MKRIASYALIFALAFGLGTVFLETGIAQNWPPYFSGVPSYQPVRYESSLPTFGRFPGEVVGVISGTSSILYFWDAGDGDWERVTGGQEEDATFDGTVTVTGAFAASSTVAVTGATTLNGSVTLGDANTDDITVNGPVISRIKREAFDFVPAMLWDITNGDFTGGSVADTNENLIVLPGSQVGAIYYRVEQAFGGTLSLGVILADGELKADSASLLDANDNDAVEFVFGGTPAAAVNYGNPVIFDEDVSGEAYCEVSITVATVANLTADDFYFGVSLNAALTDGFAINGDNTYAVFIMSDNAGDLDIETELNGGGTLNDDSGTTWTDGQTKVLRVEISADDVDFFVDGTQVTQANAVLDADATDRFVCKLGVRSSGTAAGVDVNYVEIGAVQ